MTKEIERLKKITSSDIRKLNKEFNKISPNPKITEILSTKGNDEHRWNETNKKSDFKQTEQSTITEEEFTFMLGKISTRTSPVWIPTGNLYRRTHLDITECYWRS